MKLTPRFVVVIRPVSHSDPIAGIGIDSLNPQRFHDRNLRSLEITLTLRRGPGNNSVARRANSAVVRLGGFPGLTTRKSVWPRSVTRICSPGLSARTKEGLRK